MTCAYQNNVYNYWAIPAVLTTFFEPLRRFTVVESSVVGILLMLFLFYIIIQNKRKCVVFAVWVWICCGIFFGYNAVYNVSSIYKEVAVVLSMPTYNTDFNAVCNYIHENNIQEFAVCAADGYRAVDFQVANPDLEIIGITCEENWVEGLDVYIVDKANWGIVDYSNVVYENANYLIFME